MNYNKCKIKETDNGLIISAVLNGEVLEELKKIIRRCERHEKIMSRISKNYEKEIEEVLKSARISKVL